MNLTDILGGAGVVVATMGVFYAIDKYFIPYANKLQEKCDKEEKEAGDDYKISYEEK